MRETSASVAEQEIYHLQAEFCKGMAHPKRIQILRTLKAGEKTVTQIAKLTGIPQANASQHLALLRQFGLLTARHDGTNVYYAISDHRIVEACELVRNCIAERVRRSQIMMEIPP